MAVSEREIASLGMAIGGNVPPYLHIAPELRRRHPESAVVDLIFEHIEKDKERSGVWVFDCGEFPKTWIGPGIRVELRRAIDGKAHVITAPAELGQLR